MLDADIESDIAASSVIDISRCKVVCLLLGPYRNLTTLTAATLFLHPHCQVLNHAGVRIFGQPRLDFLSDFSTECLDTFIRYAIWISANGARGDFGGSITLSHAFEPKHPMYEAFQRSGGLLLKPDIHCLFWKESQRTTNALRGKEGQLESIFAADTRLRFVLPIRNPMDCAISNLKTGHVAHLRGLTGESPVIEVVRVILDEVLWFARLQAKYPGRFFSFFEHEMTREMFTRLAAFLNLEASDPWLEEAVCAARTLGGYEHDCELVEAYGDHVEKQFAEFPDLKRGLMKFVTTDHEQSD